MTQSTIQPNMMCSSDNISSGISIRSMISGQGRRDHILRCVHKQMTHVMCAYIIMDQSIR